MELLLEVPHRVVVLFHLLSQVFVQLDACGGFGDKLSLIDHFALDEQRDRGDGDEVADHILGWLDSEFAVVAEESGAVVYEVLDD